MIWKKHEKKKKKKKQIKKRDQNANKKEKRLIQNLFLWEQCSIQKKMMIKNEKQLKKNENKEQQ